MKSVSATSLVLSIMLASPAVAADDPLRNQAYNDHVAYVATFVLPVLIKKCANSQPGYMAKAAPLYFDFVNSRQPQIERGRLLTLSELPPGGTLQEYRENVIKTRIGKLDTGTPQEQRKMCDGAVGVMSGMKLPGEWPPRD